METVRKRVLVCALAVLAFVGADARAQASSFDHLKCYRVRDALPRGAFTADLVPEQSPPFAVEPGCKIKLPAKLFCTDVRKTNVQPAPPLQVDGADARDYLCYAVSCPFAPSASGLQVRDQFGDRLVTVRSSKMLCAPAETVPTATATPPPPVDCQLAAFPACDGVCSGPPSGCVPLGGACVCVQATATRTPTPSPTPTSAGVGT